MPQLIFTEVQTESVSQSSKEKKAGIARNEFVEFLVLKGGNLAGLELCSGYDGETKKFVFPPLDVQTGEVLLVHMRNRGEGCINETGDELDLAFAPYSHNEVRDLWTDIDTTTLGNKTDVLILRNTADNKLIDAFMYRAGNIEAWTKTMIDYSQLIDESDIYESGDIENAFISDGITATKTMVRSGALELQQKVLSGEEGEEIEFPVKSGTDTWGIPAEPSPGWL